jgi:hypothetical protein
MGTTMGKTDELQVPLRCRRRRALAVLGSTVIMLGLIACVAPGPRPATPIPPLFADPARDRWPTQILEADPDVQDVYHFAVAHPELRWIPCYCGCVNQNHTSNWDCYVAKESSDGLLLSAHALDCGICLSITRDVRALEGQGLPPRAIRDQIDVKWGLAGPGTKTPLPPA